MTMSDPAPRRQSRLTPRAGQGHFFTTRWTRVALAQGPTQDGKEALSDLCADYYAPVLAFLNRHTPAQEEARDLAHEFFAYLLQGEALRSAAQDKGRFRSYLLGALKHFLLRHREIQSRLKRGGGAAHLSLQAETETTPAPVIAQEDHLSPDAAFDRQWALTVLEHAMRGLKEQCAQEGKAGLFARLQPWLTGDSEHGDQHGLAASLGISVNTLKSDIHRLRQRFRARVKEEIAATLEKGGDVQEEMQVLMNALRSR